MVAPDQNQAKQVETEFVTAEHFCRVVSELEEEIRNLKDAKSKVVVEEKGEGEGTFLSQFAGEVGVTGLTDSIKAKHKVVKLLWLLVFFGGLAAAVFFVYKTFEEYRNEPTASKIGYILKDKYPFPHIVLCVDTWLDTEKALALGLSKEGIQYAFRYLIPFEEVAEQQLKRSKNMSGVEEEFVQVFQKHKFASLKDFFKHIAIDVVLNSNDEREIGFSCSGCQHSEHLEKVIIDKAVCYQLLLDGVDGKFRQSYGLPDFKLRVPDLSQGLLDRKAYWKLYINPLKTQLMADMPYTSIHVNYSHSLRIMSELYGRVPREYDPCVLPNEKADPLTVGMTCILGCAASYYRILHGCRVLNLDWNHSRPLSDYCNTYQWDRWPSTNADINRTQVLLNKCIGQCKDECDFVWYETTIDYHLSFSLGKEMGQWRNRSGTDMSAAKLYFINIDAIGGGITTFTEVSTYSFQNFIGNIGGTCGIWIGASVMTLIQLFMFFVERSLNNGCCDSKMKKTEIVKDRTKKDHEMVINGTEHSEQAALV